MPKIAKYPKIGIPTVDEFVGKIITIPPIRATRWYVVESFRIAGASRLRLMSIPNGTTSEVNLGTMRNWIDQGRVILTEDIPVTVT